MDLKSKQPFLALRLWRDRKRRYKEYGEYDYSTKTYLFEDCERTPDISIETRRPVPQACCPNCLDDYDMPDPNDECIKTKGQAYVDKSRQKRHKALLKSLSRPFNGFKDTKSQRVHLENMSPLALSLTINQRQILVDVAVFELKSALRSAQSGNNDFTNDILERVLIRPSTPGEVTFLHDVGKAYEQLLNRCIIDDIRNVLPKAIVDAYSKTTDKFRGGSRVIDIYQGLSNMPYRPKPTQTGKDSGWERWKDINHKDWFQYGLCLELDNPSRESKDVNWVMELLCQISPAHLRQLAIRHDMFHSRLEKRPLRGFKCLTDELEAYFMAYVEQEKKFTYPTSDFSDARLTHVRMKRIVMKQFKKLIGEESMQKILP